MQDELKACPWCKSTNIDWTMLASQKFACMTCATCGARGPLVPFEMKREPIDATTAPAITAWNTRALPIADGAEVEAVARAIMQAEDGGPLGYFADNSPMRDTQWNDFDAKQHEEFRRVARAAISAMLPRATEDGMREAGQQLSDQVLNEWFELSKRDHFTFVGSEIRQLIGDLRRARNALSSIPAGREGGGS